MLILGSIGSRFRFSRFEKFSNGLCNFIKHTENKKSKTNCLASARTLREHEKVRRIQSPDVYMPSG